MLRLVLLPTIILLHLIIRASLFICDKVLILAFYVGSIALLFLLFLFLFNLLRLGAEQSLEVGLVLKRLIQAVHMGAMKTVTQQLLDIVTLRLTAR